MDVFIQEDGFAVSGREPDKRGKREIAEDAETYDQPQCEPTPEWPGEDRRQMFSGDFVTHLPEQDPHQKREEHAQQWIEVERSCPMAVR